MIVPPDPAPVAADEPRLDRTGGPAYFRQATAKAIAYRLRRIRAGDLPEGLLAHELPNVLHSVRESQLAGAWDVVGGFHDHLQQVLDLRGHWAELLTLNDWAQSAAAKSGDRLRTARLAHDRANLIHQQGQYAQADRQYRACEAAFRSLGETAWALKSRHMRSLVLRAQGRASEAERLCATTVDEARRLGLDRWLAHPLYVRGLIDRDRGRLEDARRAVEESLHLLDGADEPAMVAQCHHFLGELALIQGDLARARDRLGQSLRLSEQLGILRRVAATQRLLGDLAIREGRPDEAERTYQTALDTVIALGDRPQSARLLLSLAQLAATGRADPRRAIELLNGSVAAYAAVGDRRGHAVASWWLARLLYRQGQHRQARRCLANAIASAWRAGFLHPRALTGLRHRWRAF